MKAKRLLWQLFPANLLITLSALLVMTWYASSTARDLYFDQMRQDQGNYLTISVEDQGVGIEEEHLERLFERFYRTDKARNSANGETGLGLSIVKHIAGAHGGTVTVKSKPDAGSTFTLIIPQ